MKKVKPKKKKPTKKQIDNYGRKLCTWLYSDPAYAYRLNNEGSANW